MTSLFNSTSDGWPYIAGTQNASLIDDYALELATKLDAVVPFAMAAGSVVMTITSATNGSASVTFPVGRFTVAPIVTCISAGGTGSSAFYVATTSITTSGMTVQAFNRDNAAATASITVHWHAVQMNTGAASG